MFPQGSESSSLSVGTISYKIKNKNLHPILPHHFLHHQSLAVLIHYLRIYGYGFLFLGTLMEGELILLTAGFLSYLGLMNFWLVLLFGFFGAIVGDNLWFWIGYKVGPNCLERFGKYLFLNETRIQKAKLYFNNHGRKTVFASRFIFGTRISSAILAGAFGMQRKTFVKSNVLGAGVWAIITAMLGYLFGSSFNLLARLFRRAEISLLILLLLAIIILILRFSLNSEEA